MRGIFFDNFHKFQKIDADGELSIEFFVQLKNGEISIIFLILIGHKISWNLIAATVTASKKFN